MFAEKGRNCFQKHLKTPSPILQPSNLIHGSAESSSQLGNDTIAHDTKLWDSNYYVLLLSDYSRHLKADVKVLCLFLEYFTWFIKAHSWRTLCWPISYYFESWLLYLESASDNCFKISSQLDAPTLVEAIRTIYGYNIIPMSFPDIEMVVDVSEDKEVAFTLNNNKKHKEKSK